MKAVFSGWESPLLLTLVPAHLSILLGVPGLLGLLSCHLLDPPWAPLYQPLLVALSHSHSFIKMTQGVAHSLGSMFLLLSKVPNADVTRSCRSTHFKSHHLSSTPRGLIFVGLLGDQQLSQKKKKKNLHVLINKLWGSWVG